MNKTVIEFPTKKYAFNGWVVEDEVLLGEGSFGDVFKVCKENNCNFAMKVIYDSFHEDVKREICIQKICAKYNLCKPVIDSWLIQNGGVIISPVMKYTLSQKIDEILESFNSNNKLNNSKNKVVDIIKNVWRMILKLHKLGIYHGDALIDNIMIDDNDDIFFIDMGESGFSKEVKNNKDLLDLYVLDYQLASDVFKTANQCSHIYILIYESINNILIHNKDFSYKYEEKVINKLLNINYNDFYNMLKTQI
jgi:tRNA A-37 threonylcarbamoyl transferase component Bud32